jgi:hypothetical protein
MRFFSALLFFILCCCKAASTSSQEPSSLQKIVTSEIGASAIIEKNNSATFALAQQTENKSVSFLVIRLSDLKIVIKEKIIGSVTWSGEMEIKIIRTPGIVKTNAQPEDNIRVINLNNYVIHKK